MLSEAAEKFSAFISNIEYTTLDKTFTKFFGFSEFISGLALLMLVWTMADTRYKFRMKTLPFSLQKVTFFFVLVIGTLTLISDSLRASGSSVISLPFFTQSLWQFLLGGFFFGIFMFWLWVAVHKPSSFGKLNYKNYCNALFEVIQRGSPNELAIISNELFYSVKSIVKYAPEIKPYKSKAEDKHFDEISGYANDLLLLIGDRRFCRAIVESSSGTAYAFFKEISVSKKYNVQIRTFAKNVLNEAIENKNSFLFHETNGYDSGLIGYLKPLSQAMFSDYDLVESVGTLLDPDYEYVRKWDKDQWEAYCRVVLLVIAGYIKAKESRHSYVLYRALGLIENSTIDLSKLNGLPVSSWDDEIYERLRVVLDFIKKSIELYGEESIPRWVIKSKLNKLDHKPRSFHDHLSKLILETIDHSAYVKFPTWSCWMVQHNSLWGELFRTNNENSETVKLIQYKLRRLIFDEIKEMEKFPNYRGARLLGFCLNVLGFQIRDKVKDRNNWALQKAVLSWTKNNFKALRSKNIDVAENCLVEGFSYDSNKNRLVKIYPAQGLRTKAKKIYFNLN